jgi:hypothetical protein
MHAVAFKPPKQQFFNCAIVEIIFPPVPHLAWLLGYLYVPSTVHRYTTTHHHSYYYYNIYYTTSIIYYRYMKLLYNKSNFMIAQT